MLLRPAGSSRTRVRPYGGEESQGLAPGSWPRPVAGCRGRGAGGRWGWRRSDPVRIPARCASRRRAVLGGRVRFPEERPHSETEADRRSRPAPLSRERKTRAAFPEQPVFRGPRPEWLRAVRRRWQGWSPFRYRQAACVFRLSWDAPLAQFRCLPGSCAVSRRRRRPPQRQREVLRRRQGGF